MRFIDTNIFIRFFTGDDSVKAQACRQLLLRIEAGEERATTSESVIAEVVFVLRSKRHYDIGASRVRDLFAPLLSLPGLHVQDKKRFLRALDLMASQPFLDFEDALSAVHMQRLGIDEIYSYDRDFDRVSDIVRVEP